MHSFISKSCSKKKVETEHSGKSKDIKNSYTGATDHVTYSKYYFISFYTTKPVTVKLPNDSHVTTNYAGMI